MVGRPAFPFGDPANFQGRTVLGSVGFCFCRCWWEILKSQEWTAWIFQVWSPVDQHGDRWEIRVFDREYILIDGGFSMSYVSLPEISPFNCKTNKARGKMQIESTFNHIRAGRLRLWEKRYKQNIQNLDFFKMCINFNVYNCIRNTKVYIYIQRQRERVWVHVLFFTIYNVLYLYIYLFVHCWIVYVYACGTV